MQEFKGSMVEHSAHDHWPGFTAQEGMKNQRESGKEKGRESSCGSQGVLIGHTSTIFHLKHYLYWVICWLSPLWRSQASHCRERLLIWFIWSFPVMRLKLHNWMHRISSCSPRLEFPKSFLELTEKLQEGMILVGKIQEKKIILDSEIPGRMILAGSALGFCSRRSSDWIYLAHSK